MRRRAAAAGGAAAAGLAGLGAWYRTLQWSGEPDERLTARTADGWALDVSRYRPQEDAPRRQHPVVLCHGFAGTALIFDLAPEVSLARHLARAGFDVYAVNLRGRAGSWPASGEDRSLQWSFDDFVYQDLPAAVRLVCATAGAPEVLWCGMEMSGQVLYAAAISGTAGAIRAGVTFGSPAVTPPSAKVPGVTAAPQLRRRGRVPVGSAARPFGPVLAYARSRQLSSSFVMEHTDPLPVARYFLNGIPDESTTLADQFSDWVANATMRSLDHHEVWSERLHEVSLPLLLLAAERDLQRPPDAVAATAASIGRNAAFRRIGRASGFSVDHGHDDLLVAAPAAAEVFPLVTDWLAAHD